jgi:hypothetical protein
MYAVTLFSKFFAKLLKLGASNARLASLALASFALLLQASFLHAAQEREHKQAAQMHMQARPRYNNQLSNNQRWQNFTPPTTPNQAIINAQRAQQQERDAYRQRMIQAAQSIQADVRKIRQRASDRELEKNRQSLLTQGAKEERLQPFIESCKADFKRREDARLQKELSRFKRNLARDMLNADID